MGVPTVNAVGIAVRDALRDHLTDPLGRGDTSQWIHYGDVQKHAKSPQVFIQPPRTQLKWRRLGSSRRDRIFYFNCVVEVGISPLISTNLNKVMDDVVSEILNTVEDHTFSITGVWEMKVDNVSGSFYVEERKAYDNVVTVACYVENEGTRNTIYS